MIVLRPTTLALLLAGAFVVGWGCYDVYVHVDRGNALLCPVCYRPLDDGDANP